jgi:hypothetical protein
VFDDCVWSVALDRNDAGECALIVDETNRTRCHDGILLSQATDAVNAGLCADIEDEETREGCEYTVSRLVAETKGCDAEGAASEVCRDQAVLASVTAQKDPDLCASLADEGLVARCLEVVGPGDPDLDGVDSSAEQENGTDPHRFDTDGDGLSDYDELYVWLTNPTNPDSDGDTYTDGGEVAAGYDPLGPGTL